MPRISKPLILIVEDEEQLANVIAEHLENAGMQTQVYYRCAPAMRFLKRNFANLMLLDLNLPDSSGFAFLQELRSEDIRVPTIFVTGTNAEGMKIKGLDEMGGDDYIVKPFSYPELIARIRAVLRRAETSGDMNVAKNVRVTDEPFDFLGAKVLPLRLEIEFPGNRVAKIGRKELGILAYLNDHPGVVIPRKALIHSVWGIHADVRSRSLDQYIVKVRDLFEAHGIQLNAFRTIHGVGYIYDPQGTSQLGRDQAAAPAKVLEPIAAAPVVEEEETPAEEIAEKPAPAPAKKAASKPAKKPAKKIAKSKA
ncbi:MAG TPA: response regulator transcription factor [Opitutaceae bacterium]|nr:response regulator transcription factor [Opitutaceae bacterium]